MYIQLAIMNSQLYKMKYVMMWKNFVLCVSAVFFCGCSQSTQEVKKYSGFEQTVSVQSTRIDVPPVLLYPRNLFLLDDKLIVLNEKTDTLFQVFGLPHLVYQGQFGVKGEGPQDFHLPAIQPVSRTASSFVLCDLTRLKTVSWDASGPRVIAANMPSSFQYYNGLQQLQDSIFCCNAEYTSDNELRFIYRDGTYKELGEYPEQVEPRFKDALARGQAYSSLLVAKPDGSSVAVFYQHVRRYRIYDADGKLKSDNVVDMQPAHEWPDVKDEQRYIHPIAVYATDRYIYTLNLDMTAADIGTAASNPSVQVFDWEGHPLKRYQLDRFISSFTVDEQKGLLYGVFVEDEDAIYQFELS